MTLRVQGLWRYPVKSLAGEALEAAELTADGIPGDRIVHVCGPEGVRTSRRHYRLLGLRGTLDPNGQVQVNGHPWDSPEALAAVKATAGNDAWLGAYEGLERFDVPPLLVATDGAVAAFGRDIRRLRPNILIGGVHGMDEINWPGNELHIGEAVIRLDSRRGRCPMTTVDPDTLERDPEVLRDIARRFNGQLALNAEVLRPGVIRVGDAVTLNRVAPVLSRKIAHRCSINQAGDQNEARSLGFRVQTWIHDGNRERPRVASYSFYCLAGRTDMRLKIHTSSTASGLTANPGSA